MPEYKSLKDHVFEYISEQIHSGKMKPNSKINEQSICDVLQVSRTPVREALIQLTNEGILEQSPRRGFRVKEVDVNKVKQIYSLIGVLEGFAASLSINNITDYEITLMKKLTDDMDFYITNHDFDNYYKAQLKFHELFINPCDNDELINTIQTLKMKFIRRSYVLDEHNKNLVNVLLETNMEHKHICELFINKETSAIEDYIRNIHWSFKYAEFDSMA